MGRQKTCEMGKGKQRAQPGTRGTRKGRDRKYKDGEKPGKGRSVAGKDLEWNARTKKARNKNEDNGNDRRQKKDGTKIIEDRKDWGQKYKTWGTAGDRERPRHKYKEREMRGVAGISNNQGQGRDGNERNSRGRERLGTEIQGKGGDRERR